jgi:hypothetical protein
MCEQEFQRSGMKDKGAGSERKGMKDGNLTPSMKLLLSSFSFVELQGTASAAIWTRNTRRFALRRDVISICVAIEVSTKALLLSYTAPPLHGKSSF